MIARADVTAWRSQAPWPSDEQVEQDLINSREHFSVFGFETKDFEMKFRWFSGRSSVLTYTLDELLGTKLRALYQRRKGRDLFDLWYAAHHGEVDFDRLTACFREYLERSGLLISRAEFEENLAEKLVHPDFASDLHRLLSPDVEWSFTEAAQWFASEILPRLPGEPWQGSEGLPWNQGT